ncbi:PAS domain S-box protein [bacterium]|nr:PAS domain S-box protein [bacterium]
MPEKSTLDTSDSPKSAPLHDGHQKDARFRALLDLNNNAAFLLDLPEGTIIDGNSAGLRITGKTADELRGQPLADLLLTPIRHSLPSFFRTDRKQPDSLIKTEIENDKGEIISVELVLRRAEFGGKSYSVATLRDLRDAQKSGLVQSVLYQITKATVETRNLTELLANIHRELGSLIDTTNFFVALYDSEKGAYSFPYFVDEYDTVDDKSFYQMDRSLTDYVRRTAEPIRVDPATHEKLIKAGEADVVGVDSFLWLGAPLQTPSGVIGVVVVQSYHESTDYTADELELLSYVSDHIALAIERKQAEEELRSREERLNITLSATQDIIVDWDLETGVFFFSERFYEMLGSDIDEIEPGFDGWKSLLHQDDAERAEQVFCDHLDNKTLAYEDEYRLLHKDGGYHWILARGKVIERGKDGQAKRFAGTLSDITERKRTEQLKQQWEERIFHSQKMEAIGNLAGGVAHDFNNLLTAITGHLDLAMLSLQEDHPASRDIQEVQRAAERASNLTKQLLTFSRKQSFETKVVNVNAIISDMDRMLRRLIREDISLTTNLSDNLWNAKIDPGKFEQVIVNLVVNARDAMPDGGSLIISTSNTDVDYQKAEMLGIESGNHVRVSVKDSGIGMSEEVRRQIFDPFFTTKEKEKGTGLGLSTVFGIIKQSQGGLEVLSDEGRGTEFVFYIKEDGGAVQSHASTAHSAALISGRGETILVVEDDIAVREMIISTLERLGFTVLNETDGEAGLACVREKCQEINLVISDVVMPRLSGLDFAEKAWEFNPDLKFVFISGYMDENSRLEQAVHRGHGFLPKPFRSNALVEQIHQMLHA